MSKCCNDNNCVELVPSGCVRYTGTPTPGGLIDSQDYCDPFLNDIIKLLDDNVTNLDTKVGLDKTAFDSVNTSCGTTPVISTTGLTVKDGKYYSAEVVMKLVAVICELRSRMNYLVKEDINVNSGNVHWLDLPLDQSFKTWLADSCLITNPCNNEPITDLRGLFQAIITKLCTCCP